jgi:hypothetical protein
VFGESNEVFSPIVGGTTADDIKTGHVARLNDRLPGPHHDDEAVASCRPVGLHQPRDALERSPSR